MAKDQKNKDDGAESPVVSDPSAAVTAQMKIDADARARTEAENADALAAARKMMREQAERDKLRPLPPITQSVTAAIARPEESTVTMIVPRDMFIWAEPDGSHPVRYKVSFRRGVQEVPVSLSEHWYLRANNVLPYEAHADGKSIA